MTSRLPLILAGAVAVVAIGFSMMLRHVDTVPVPVLLAMLLGTYAVGLGIGTLALNRRG